MAKMSQTRLTQLVTAIISQFKKFIEEDPKLTKSEISEKVEKNLKETLELTEDELQQLNTLSELENPSEKKEMDEIYDLFDQSGNLKKPENIIVEQEPLIQCGEEMVSYRQNMILEVKAKFMNPLNTNKKFDWSGNFRIEDLKSDLSETDFHTFLFELLNQTFLPMISNSFRLHNIRVHNIYPESKQYHSRSNVKFCRGKSTYPLSTNNNFSFELFTDSTSSVSVFNVKGTTNNFKKFDESRESDEYKQIAQVEKFFTKVLKSSDYVKPKLEKEGKKEIQSDSISLRFVRLKQVEKDAKAIKKGKPEKKESSDKNEIKKVSKPKLKVKKIKISNARGFSQPALKEI